MASLSSLISRFAIARQIPIFSKLSWLELRKIAKRSAIFEYRKGEIIRRQGDPADNFYCIVSGRIQSFHLLPSGTKEHLEFLHRGMHFGIISVMTGEVHSLTYEALNDTIILQIPKDEFLNILRSIPQLGVELSHSLSQRIRRNVLKTGYHKESMVISIYSPVKGSGSSTYAVNLALGLERETGKKVIFVSINPSSKVSTEVPFAIGEASPQWKHPPVNLSQIAHDHERMQKSILRNDIKIDLLNVVFDLKDSSSISPFISALTDQYHYIVVDLPNEKDDVVLKTLTQSDLVQLIIWDRDEDLRMTREIIQGIKSAIKENFQADKLQVILSGMQEKEYESFEDINKRIEYFVSLKLPPIERPRLNVAVVSEGMTVIVSDPLSDYTKMITRIARRIGGVLVGLVLGGGAALGIAHVGVIRVLEEENIPIDIVVGSSMGALLGALWAVGNKAAALEKIAREFTKKKSMLKLLDPPLSPGGLVGGIAIKRWLRGHMGDKTFYDTVFPLKIVAYDLLHREEIVIESGSLIEAVRRSIAIPGVIPPIQEDGKLIIDGGVLNPLPTNVLRNLGINKIIAVNVLQSPDHASKGHELELKQLIEDYKIPFLKSPLKFIGLRMAKLIYPNVADIIVRTLQATEYVIAEKSAENADVLIHPNLVGINWFELYRVDDLVNSGEAATRQALPQIKELIKR